MRTTSPSVLELEENAFMLAVDVDAQDLSDPAVFFEHNSRLSSMRAQWDQEFLDLEAYLHRKLQACLVSPTA